MTLSTEALQLGKNFELVHSSQWSEGAPVKRACWSESLEPLSILKHISEQAGGSVIQSDQINFEKDVRAWVNLREASAEYFKKPLQALLAPTGTFEERSLENREKKPEIRDWISDFGTRFCNVSGQEDLLCIFEELFMNALIDAPRESGREGSFQGVNFFLGADDSRMGIACRDPFGSLKIEKLLRRMKEVYEIGAGTAINLRGPGGAGLGAVIMMEKSSLLCFGVIPGQVTTVSCLIHRNYSHRKRSEVAKSLHFIVGD